MRKLLTLSTVVGCVMGLNAVNPSPSRLSVGSNGSLKATHVLKPVRSSNGVKVKELRNYTMGMKCLSSQRDNKVVNPMLRRGSKARVSDGATLYEGFEAWDGETNNWIPDGWSVESNGSPDLQVTEKWGVDKPANSYGLPSAADGENVAVIGFSINEQDEWLISPSVLVNENEALSFYIYAQPVFLYDTNLIDWDAMEFTERNIIADMQVLAKAEGDTEWKTLWKLTDLYTDWTCEELIYNAPVEMEKNTIDLSEYYGKNTQFAFRYVGKDGDTMTIDAVQVAMPALDGVRYAAPLETLYWGFNREPGFGYLQLDIAQYPVFTPITWENVTYNDAATYSWSYHDPDTNDMEISDEQDALTVTYRPDFSSDFTSRNNMYYPPILTGSVPGASDGVYTAPYTYLQAGGAPEIELDNAGVPELFETGLLPFDLHSEGYTFLIQEDTEIGEMALPVFGYNCNSDLHWLNYTMNGEEPQEGDYVHMNAIMNYLFPPTAPLVINGLHVLGVGQVPESSDIEFKIEIVRTVEGVPDMDNPLAVATCTADKVLHAEYGSNDLLTIPFDFDTPFVADDSEEAYIIKFSGFRNDAIQYFAPLQSELPNPDEIAYGWIVKELYIGGNLVESYTPTVYVEGEYGPCMNAFAMNINGYYPYLTTDVTEVEFADNAPIEIPLSSYYDGSELQIETFDGVSAEATGRYGDCVLTLTRNDATAVVSGVVKVSAPGVGVEVNVSTDPASIGSINGDVDADPVAAFTPDGKRICLGNLQTGLYIVKYSDGSVRKVNVK